MYRYMYSYTRLYRKMLYRKIYSLYLILITDAQHFNQHFNVVMLGG